MEETLSTKKCYDCKLTKPVAEFSRHKNEIGGFKNQCKICCAKRRAKYYHANKIKEQEKSKRYKKERSAELSEKTKKYRKANPEKVKRWKRVAYCKTMENPASHLHQTIGTKINKMIQESRNSRTVKELLGYSFDELVQHLESRFQPGMTWENYGKEWHIDHIIPKSWFKFKGADDEEFRKCWALANLQPLWAVENLQKGNRYQSPPLSKSEP